MVFWELTAVSPYQYRSRPNLHAVKSEKRTNPQQIHLLPSLSFAGVGISFMEFCCDDATENYAKKSKVREMVFTEN